jgi:hypothetical protein
MHWKKDKPVLRFLLRISRWSYNHLSSTLFCKIFRICHEVCVYVSMREISVKYGFLDGAKSENVLFFDDMKKLGLSF